MADVVPPETRSAFGDVTNKNPGLDGGEKQGRRVLRWLDDEFTETCKAPVCFFPQRLITDDDAAVI